MGHANLVCSALDFATIWRRHWLGPLAVKIGQLVGSEQKTGPGLLPSFSRRSDRSIDPRAGAACFCSDQRKITVATSYWSVASSMRDDQDHLGTKEHLVKGDPQATTFQVVGV